jgi:hypothetical protein
LTLGGYLFEIKQHPDGLRTALVKVDARRPRTLIVPFPEQGKRGIYQEGKVWVQTDAGAMVEELPAPRTAYEGHERHTPWNDLQYFYFIGYAFWNYFTTPLLLTLDGVICEEIEPWEEKSSEVAPSAGDLRSFDRHSLCSAEIPFRRLWHVAAPRLLHRSRQR